MSEDSMGASTASMSTPTDGMQSNKSVAAPSAVLGNLIWLGGRASVMTKWEREFLFDCTGLIEQELQLSNKQVSQIKHLRVKYAGR